MRISSITTTRKAKQFSYTPRHFDPDKEDFENRKAEVEARILGTTNSSGRSNFTGFKNKWKSGKNTQNFEKKSNIRMAIIIAILAGLCYLILK